MYRPTDTGMELGNHKMSEILVLLLLVGPIPGIADLQHCCM